MEDLIVFYKVLLGICSGLTAIWGTVKIVKEMQKPSKEVKEHLRILDSRVEDMEKGLIQLEAKAQEYTDKKVEAIEFAVNKQAAQINNIDSCMEGMLQSLFAIGNHMISGNDVVKIKEANAKILEDLIRQRAEKI